MPVADCRFGATFVRTKTPTLRSNIRFRIGLIGHGSWATALAKILTDNHFRISWLMPKPDDVAYFRKFRHPPRYLTTVRFDPKMIRFCHEALQVIQQSDWVVICMPSLYAGGLLDTLPREAFREKYIVSGIKGMLPETNLLVNEYLQDQFGVAEEQYFAITGPCHAEEVAAEKLSYITISGADKKAAEAIARRFTTSYLKTIVTGDVWGAQYAAVLKNVYAIGAGIAHGLGYGDNFLAVYTANCAAELARFSQAASLARGHARGGQSAFASAYLGDLLVTCYSQYSRNRTFGAMIGKGYSVQSAHLEMNMVAEGYYAARCIQAVSGELKIPLPIAGELYRVLWEQGKPAEAFARLRKTFV